MSKLALLIGAKPRKDKIGPVVRLEKGRYSVELENVVDSIIVLSGVLGQICQLIHGSEIELEAGDYFTHITSGGKEAFINAAVLRIG